MRKLFCLSVVASLFSGQALAFEPFTVKEIRLEGLQRISAGATFNYLPVKVGNVMTESLSAEAIRALYKTGFFKDVRLEKEGDVLIVFVAERPAIAEVTFEGNSEIETEKLQESLKQIGLSKGKVLDRAMLDVVKQELQRQYYSLGKYSAKITSKMIPLERNRVKIKIEISEGKDAKVYAVNIVGNKVFSNKVLVPRLELSSGLLGFGKNKYSKQLLSADLETLKSYYLDRGYINFNIDSTQVSLTPDKQDVYITINITEGEQYTVRNIKLAGELIFPKEQLMSMISLKSGDIFSRKETVESTKRISDLLSAQGYAFANVNIVPDIDKESRTVGLTLFIDPGRRVYVRRVNISGNNKSKDEVIRRELRQMEGDWMSTTQVSLSRTRLDRTGYFETVNVETPTVPGTTDQVDVNFSVKERATGNFSAGLGYSDTQGLILNLGISQENFMGTGKRIALNLDNSQVTKRLSFDFFNPYSTLDGVSRGFSVYLRQIDAAAADISNYTTDSYGFNLVHAYPTSEVDRLRFSIGYDHTDVVLGTTLVSQDVLDFVEENGNVYDDFPLLASWTRDTRNRRILANKGSQATAGLLVTVPGSTLEYYKLDLSYLQYFALGKITTLSIKGRVGYGDGYGQTTRLPPWKHYYAGGSRTVRGYESNSMGPRDPVTDQPIGGDRMLIANVELILPNPITAGEGSTRISAFVDAGNVFVAGYEGFGLNELRYSAGLSFVWISPFAPLQFSYAVPLNAQPGDRLQAFQFTFGSAF